MLKFLVRWVFQIPYSLCAKCGAVHDGGRLHYCAKCGQSFDGQKYGPPTEPFGVRWPEPFPGVKTVYREAARTGDVDCWGLPRLRD